MTLSTVRSSRPFAWGDLVIYAILAVLIVGVCLAVFLPKTTTMQSVVVYYKNVEVYRYDCQTKQGKAISCEGVRVEEEDDRVSIITEKGVNVLTFGEQVKMVETNCRTRECVEGAPLRYSGDVLVCMPHDLLVVAYGEVTNEVVL